MLSPLSRARFGAGIFGVIALMCSSCSSGDSLYPVSGRVMVKDKPAVGASVVFLPDGPASLKMVPSSGTVGEDGSFTINTGDKRGAPAGKYIVTVIWPDPSKKPTATQKMMGMTPDAPDLLGGRYGSREKTSLRAEIKSGENKLDTFQLQ